MVLVNFVVKLWQYGQIPGFHIQIFKLYTDNIQKQID